MNTCVYNSNFAPVISGTYPTCKVTPNIFLLNGVNLTSYCSSNYIISKIKTFFPSRNVNSLSLKVMGFFFTLPFLSNSYFTLSLPHSMPLLLFLLIILFIVFHIFLFLHLFFLLLIYSTLKPFKNIF